MTPSLSVFIESGFHPGVSVVVEVTSFVGPDYFSILETNTFCNRKVVCIYNRPYFYVDNSAYLKF